MMTKIKLMMMMSMMSSPPFSLNYLTFHLQSSSNLLSSHSANTALHTGEKETANTQHTAHCTLFTAQKHCNVHCTSELNIA